MVKVILKDINLRLTVNLLFGTEAKQLMCIEKFPHCPDIRESAETLFRTPDFHYECINETTMKLRVLHKTKKTLKQLASRNF